MNIFPPPYPYVVGKHVVDVEYAKGDLPRLVARCVSGPDADCKYHKGLDSEYCDITDYLKDTGPWDCFDGTVPDGFILKQKSNDIEFYWQGTGEDAEGWFKFK